VPGGEGCKAARGTFSHVSARRCTTPSLRRLARGRLSSSDPFGYRGTSRCSGRDCLCSGGGLLFNGPALVASSAHPQQHRRRAFVGPFQFHGANGTTFRTNRGRVSRLVGHRKARILPRPGVWRSTLTYFCPEEAYRADRIHRLRPSRRDCNGRSSTASRRVFRRRCVRSGRTLPSCNVCIQCDRASGSAADSMTGHFWPLMS
jgi:hypothetical protein